MRFLKHIFIVIVVLSLSKDKQCVAQNYADKNYYLVDSLDLDLISEDDRLLIDSCLQVFHSAREDLAKVDAIGVITEEVWNNKVWPKYNLWVKNYIEIKLKKKGISDDLLGSLATAYSNVGYYHKNFGEINKAYKSYEKSLKIRTEINDREGLASVLNEIGKLYYSQGNIVEAIKYLDQSLKIREEVGDKDALAYTLNDIGVVYDNQENLESALNYYNRSLMLQKEVGNKKVEAYTLSNIGHVYYKEYKRMLEKDGFTNLTYEKYNKLLSYYLESLELRLEINDKKGISESYNNLGAIYGEKAIYLKNNNANTDSVRINMDKGMYYHLKGLEIREQLNYKPGIASSLNNIGHMYLAKGDTAGAKSYAKRSLKISQDIGTPLYIKRSAELLSKIYRYEKEGMQALEMFELYIIMRDSINNKSTQKAAAQQQAKYEYEKQKSIDDIEHEKSLAIEQEIKKKQSIIIYSIVVGLLLVVAFLVIIYNRLRLTKKQKLIIEEKNKEIMDSITYAKRIQNAILPPKKVVKEYLQESFILYKPKDIVAGDFYWMEHKKEQVLFAAADCTGHGVPGAMVSVVCNNGLNRSVREYGLTDPSEILNKTREIVIAEFEKSEEDVKDGMDIALCSLRFNVHGSMLKNNKEILNLKAETAALLEYAGAHNPLWIIRKDSNEVEEIKANKQPIGKCDNPEPYKTHVVELQKGDSIYIFTDGYVDQFGGEKGKKFKSKAFKELLLSINNKSMEEQNSIIDNAFEVWKGDLEQIDDVCVIGVKI